MMLVALIDSLLESVEVLNFLTRDQCICDGNDTLCIECEGKDLL